MKLKLTSILTTVAVGWLTSTATLPAQNELRVWNGGTGNWSDNGNWNIGTTTDNKPKQAQINNGGTALISSGTVEHNIVFLGSFAGDSGTLTVTGGTANFAELYVGYFGNATLNLSGSGVINSYIELAVSAGTSGVLNLGNGSSAPGSINGSIHGGDGNAKVNVNHSESNYVLSNNLTGTLALELKGGTTTLSGSKSYSGGTTISGGELRISANNNLGAGSGSISMSGGTTLHTTATLSMNRAMSLGSGINTIEVDSSTTTTQSGVISGAGTLNKTGAGTLVLSGTNTYSGGTVINSGVIQISADANLGGASGAVTFNGGTLRTTGTFSMTRGSILNVDGIYDIGSGTVTQSGVISGAGALTKTGTGTLVLSGTNTYGGGTNLNGGTIQVSSNANLGNATTGLSFNGGRLKASESITTARAATLGASGGGFEVDAGKTLTYEGVISGEGALTKTGAGTLILSATNTYEGGTQFNAGAIQVSSDDSLGAASGGLTFNGGTLKAADTFSTSRDTTLNAAGGVFDVDDDETLTHEGVIGGVGSLTKQGDGTLLLTGTNTYSSGTIFNSGVVEVAEDSNLGDVTGSLAFNGGTLHTTASFSMNRATTLNTDGGTFDVATDTELTQQGVISGVGALTKEGEGKLILTGTNTYEGGTVFNNGVVEVVDDSNLGDASGGLTLNGGTLHTTASFSMNRATTLNTDGGTFDVATDTELTQQGVISGVGALTKEGEGKLILTGTNTYEGGTVFNNGVVEVAEDANLGAATGDLTFDGGTLHTTASFNMDRATTLNTDGGTFDVDTDTELTQAGIIDGVGALTKDGEGKLILTATNTYSGGTTLNGGVVEVAEDSNLGDVLGGLSFNGGALRTTTTFTTNRATDLDTDGGTFEVETGTDLTHTGIISGTGSLTKAGEGTLILSGVNTYAGGTNMNGGAVEIAADHHLGHAAGSLSFDNAILRTKANITMNRAITFNTGGATFEVNAGTKLAQLGAISGSGALLKAGEGTLHLSGANSYTGGTTIQQGLVRTSHATALGKGPVTLTDGVLEPLQPLAVSKFSWDGGQVILPLAPVTSLKVSGAFLNGGGSKTIDLNWDGSALLPVYTLVKYGSTNFAVSDIDLQGLPVIPNVNYEHKLVMSGSSLKLLLSQAIATGPVLQNADPVLTPTFAEFYVSGPVRTGGFNNVINALIFESGSSLQVFNTLSVTSGNFIVPVGSTTVSGGQVITPGDFNKTGSGRLNINSQVHVGQNFNLKAGLLSVSSRFAVNGHAGINGGTRLQINPGAHFSASSVGISGNVAVNGVLQSPHVNVHGGGLLQGVGLIIGNVANSGTVAPGNSIGTLTIHGNYTQNRSGALQIEVGSVNHHDMLIVSGTARVGGTLEIASLGYDAAYGDQVPFLIAGNIEGKFNSITVPNADRFRGRFVDQNGIGTLVVAPTSYTLVARNQNQTNVAVALDEWIGIEEGDIGEVTLALDLLRAEEYGQAFDAIAPTYYEAALSTGIELSQSHQQLIHQYLNARRLAERVANVPVTPAPAASAKGGKGSKVVEPVAAPVETDLRWSAWTQASGLFSSGGMSLAPGEDFESGTYIVGADYLVSDNLAIGLFASYQEGWGDYDHSGDIDVESTRFGGYVTFESDSGFYANAVIGGGQTGFDVQRPIQWATLSRVADSEPDGWEFFTGISLGKDIKRGNWTFGPQVTVQYSKLELGEFNETGANVLNLRVHDANSESLRSYLGGRVAYKHKVSDRLTVIPELRAFWQHEFLGGDSFSSSLDSGFGGRFNYKTKGADEDSVFIGAGLGFLIGERVYTNVYYNTDLGRNGEENHTISINATVKF